MTPIGYFRSLEKKKKNNVVMTDICVQRRFISNNKLLVKLLKTPFTQDGYVHCHIDWGNQKPDLKNLQADISSRNEEEMSLNCLRDALVLIQLMSSVRIQI